MAGRIGLLFVFATASEAYLTAPGIGAVPSLRRGGPSFCPRSAPQIRPDVLATHRRAGAAGLRAASVTDGLVLGPPGAERFDDVKFAMPVVRRFETEEDGEFWRMWYYGRDSSFDSDVMSLPTGRVGLCESRNGIHWERVDGQQELNSILTHNKDEWWWFDTAHCGLGDVQILPTSKIKGQEEDGSVYFMYYMGGDREEVDVSGMEFPGTTFPEGTSIKGLRMRIGLCLSFDGEHWTRFEGDHHSGAVFDCGEEGEWDSLYCGWPQVVLVEPGLYRMYYHSYDANAKRFTVGYAESDDGFAWAKKGAILSGGQDSSDAKGVGCRHVVQDPKSDGWLMYGECVAEDNSHGIHLFKSMDGINWKRASDEPVLRSGEGDSWDSSAIGCPWAVPMPEGSLRLYYCAPGKGIGMAESEGDDWTKFKKVSQLKVTG